MTRPMDRARKAHLATHVPEEVNVRILCRLGEPLRKTPRMPLWWIPATTTPAVLILWFFLYAPDFSMTRFTHPETQWELERSPAPEPWFPSPGLLPEPPGNLVTLWAPGETGVQTLLDPTVSYGVCSGVQVGLQSTWATVEKRSGDHFVVLSGVTQWHVQYLEVTQLMLEVGGMVLETEKSHFTLSVTPKQVRVEILDGQVTAHRNQQEPRRLTAGQLLETTPRLPSQSRLTEQEIRERLKVFSDREQHREAAAFIRRILPDVPPKLRESLLLDLASIHGAHLHDWDGACNALDFLEREFPEGRLKTGTMHLRNRYRCQ